MNILDQLLQYANQIKNQTGKYLNTHQLVGSLFASIIEYLKNIISGQIRQPAVDTYAQLLSTYPNPEKGWTVLVRNDKTIYQWNGSQWVNLETPVYPENVATKDDLTDYAKTQTSGGKVVRTPDGTIDLSLKADRKTIFNVSQFNNKYDYVNRTAARNAVPENLRGLGQIITYYLSNSTYIESTDFTKTLGSYVNIPAGSISTESTDLMMVTINVSGIKKIRLRMHVTGGVTPGIGLAIYSASGSVLKTLGFGNTGGIAYGDFVEVDIPDGSTILKSTYRKDSYAATKGEPVFNYVELLSVSTDTYITEQYSGTNIDNWSDNTKWHLISKSNSIEYEDIEFVVDKLSKKGVKTEVIINHYSEQSLRYHFINSDNQLINRVNDFQYAIHNYDVKDYKYIELTGRFYQGTESGVTFRGLLGILPSGQPKDLLTMNGFPSTGSVRLENQIINIEDYDHISISFEENYNSSNPITLFKGVLGNEHDILRIIKLEDSIKNQNETITILRDAIVNGDNGEEVKGLIGDNQEVTVIKFKGKVFFYATQRDGHSTSETPERIVLYDYDTTTNTVSNMRVIIDKDTVGVTSRQQVKCSYMFIYDNIMYAIVTCWHPNYCALLKSEDGENFTLISNTIVDNISGFKNTQYGNHCIIPYKVNDYFYWYIEGASSGWQTKLLRSKDIESGWELVGNVEGLAPTGGTASGPKAFFKDGLIKMFYHYGPNGDLPTYLAYAEADANDPLNFKAYYRPLLNLTNYKDVWENIDQLADIEITEIDTQTYMFASLNDNSGNYGGTATTVYRWVCTKGRLSNILNLPIQ